MPIMLEGLTCDVVTKAHSATLVAREAERPPTLAIRADDGVMVWRFNDLFLAEPPPEHKRSGLDFSLSKQALLDQRALFPPAQAKATIDYGLDSPMTGKESASGLTRPIDRRIGRYPLSRIFVACPEPAGFVADTVAAPMLVLRWSGAKGGSRAQLVFHTEVAFDPAPDRRWPEPVLEVEMPHTSYANVMAALHAVA